MSIGQGRYVNKKYASRHDDLCRKEVETGAPLVTPDEARFCVTVNCSVGVYSLIATTTGSSWLELKSKV